ncbi:TPA: hypothetical protein QDB51_002696 [Burkholderia vietnamiensis]|nr:hypothetical protein [Burkholderia vietnamiensis]
MKAQPRIVKGKAREVKRSAFFHEAIALHAKFSLMGDMAQNHEAENKRLHDLIARKEEEIEKLKFQILAIGGTQL